MNTKVKLISTISVFCMILALLVTGVWAVSTANVTLGGTVRFTADNIYAKVTGSITGTNEDAELEIKELNFSADTEPEQADYDSWNNHELTFTSANLITMTITVENLSTERPLHVTVTDNTTTSNIKKEFASTVDGVGSGDTYALSKGTITYTIKMSVDQLDLSASANYSFDVDLRDANAPVETKQFELLYDETNDYYYVEMGYYEGGTESWDTAATLRWKYVSADGTTPWKSADGKPSMATGTQGWFVLETAGEGFGAATYKRFDDDSNDYASSEIRSYINGDFLTLVGIDDSDPVYSKIKARSMSDLYVDNGITYVDESEDGSGATYTCSTVQTEDTSSDKIWLLSVKEAWTLVMEKTMSGNEFPNFGAGYDCSVSLTRSLDTDGNRIYMHDSLSFTWVSPTEQCIIDGSLGFVIEF